MAELAGFPVSAKVEVWVETGDAAGLQAFLADLGKQGRAWRGTRQWQSIERDFRLSATCNPLGNVVFTVELHGLEGASEEWVVTAGLTMNWASSNTFSASRIAKKRAKRS